MMMIFRNVPLTLLLLVPVCFMNLALNIPTMIRLLWIIHNSSEQPAILYLFPHFKGLYKCNSPFFHLKRTTESLLMVMELYFAFILMLPY